MLSSILVLVSFFDLIKYTVSNFCLNAPWVFVDLKEMDAFWPTTCACCSLTAIVDSMHVLLAY
jgi:hypothetical protein